MGVVCATPVGVAPEPLEEFWTPSRAILLFLAGPLPISLFSERHLFRKGASDPYWPALPFRGWEHDVLPVERASSSWVSSCRVIQVRTHTPFEGVGCNLEASSLKLE